MTLPRVLDTAITALNDRDAFRPTITQPSVLRLDLTHVQSATDLELHALPGNPALAQEFSWATEDMQIIYHAVPGTYTASVRPVQQYDPALCYRLSMAAIPCVPPTTTVNDAYSNEALVSWPEVPGTTYELRWRTQGTTPWTTVTGLSFNMHSIGGLNVSTPYEVEVRCLCNTLAAATWTATTFTTLADRTGSTVQLTASVLLDGPFTAADNTMNDLLRVNGLIPLLEPYSALGLSIRGTTMITAALLNTAGTTAMVDWVLVELRGGQDPSIIVDSRAYILRRDGTIVDVSGSQQLGFCAKPGSYHIAVRHRNHCGVMTATPQALGSGVPCSISARAQHPRTVPPHVVCGRARSPAFGPVMPTAMV